MYDFDGFMGFTFDMHLMIFIFTYLIIFGIYYLLTLKKQGKTFNERTVINAFFIFYLLSLFRLVFLPLDVWSPEWRDILWHTQNISFSNFYNIIPFYSIRTTFETALPLFILRGVGGNLLLLLPLPIFIGLLSNKMTPQKSLLIGIYTSLFIEIIQFILNIVTWYPNRLACIDDIILNTFGAFIGGGIYIKLPFLFQKPINCIYKFMTS